MLKNWKCIIGATLLTPVCLALLGGLAFGIGVVVAWVEILQWIIRWIVGPGLVLCAISLFWCLLYVHCKVYWQKRREIT